MIDACNQLSSHLQRETPTSSAGRLMQVQTRIPDTSKISRPHILPDVTHLQRLNINIFNDTFEFIQDVFWKFGFQQLLSIF